MWCQLRKWGNLRTRGRIIKSLTVEFSSWCCLGGQLCKQKQRCQTTLAIHSSEMRAIEQKHLDPEPFKISLKNSEEWFHGRLLKILQHFGVRQKHQRHQGGTKNNCWLSWSPRIRTRQCTERPGIARRQPRWGSSQLRWGALRARFAFPSCGSYGVSSYIAQWGASYYPLVN